MGDNKVGFVAKLSRDHGGQNAGGGAGKHSVRPNILVNLLEHLYSNTKYRNYILNIIKNYHYHYYYYCH